MTDKPTILDGQRRPVTLVIWLLQDGAIIIVK